MIIASKTLLVYAITLIYSKDPECFLAFRKAVSKDVTAVCMYLLGSRPLYIERSMLQKKMHRISYLGNAYEGLYEEYI